VTENGQKQTVCYQLAVYNRTRRAKYTAPS